MKTFKNFNESKREQFDVEKLHKDCLDCFADLIDDNSINVNLFLRDNVIRIWFKSPEPNKNYRTDVLSKISLMIDDEGKYLDILKDINIGLLRLIDVYPDLKSKISCISQLTEIYLSLDEDSLGASYIG